MEKIPQVMKVKLEKLAPKPKRHSVPLDQQRRKIPELKEPYDVSRSLPVVLLQGPTLLSHSGYPTSHLVESQDVEEKAANMEIMCDYPYWLVSLLSFLPCERKQGNPSLSPFPLDSSAQGIRFDV